MQKGLVFNDVSFSYEHSHLVLSNLNLDIPAGSFVGIVGNNGSGKSTFLLTLNGLIPKHIEGSFTGSIIVDGVNTLKAKKNYLAKKIGFMFQNPDFSIFNLTVREEINFGLKNLQLDKPETRINEALKVVGLEKYSLHDPHEMSLGQKQRIALAVVLAIDTDYIVLDEPSSMLDYASSMDLYKHLKGLQTQGKTILTVEHDTDYLYEFCDYILLFEKGKILDFCETKKFFKKKAKLRRLGLKIPKIG